MASQLYLFTSGGLVMRNSSFLGRVGAAAVAVILGVSVFGFVESQPARAASAVVCHAVSDYPAVDNIAVTATGHGECIGSRYASDWEETQVCIEVWIRVTKKSGYWAVFECNSVRAESQNVLGTGAAMTPFYGFNCYRSRTRFWGTFTGVYEQAQATSKQRCYDTRETIA
jgi:hypothetical protein